MHYIMYPQTNIEIIVIIGRKEEIIMKLKKIISLLLATVIVMSVFAVSTIALADESNDFEYTVLDDGTAEITKYNGSTSKLVIPTKIDGYTVKKIGYSAFWNCKELTSVTIPSSVEEIEESAYGHYYYPFYNCYRLENIIVDKQNLNYSSLDGVLFNKDLTKILHYPEGKKDNTYVIPQTVTEVSSNTNKLYYPFINNNHLTHIIFPETVTYIGRTVATTDLENATITVLNPNCIFEDQVNVQGEQCFYGFSDIYGFPDSTSQYVSYMNFNALTNPIGNGISPHNSDIKYTIGDNSIEIYCSYNLADFISVTLDYETVDPSNYTLSEGSTILTFKSKYLDTLSVGKHIITLNYNNASVSSVLTVIAKPTEDNETENTDITTTQSTDVPEETVTDKSEATNNTESDTYEKETTSDKTGTSAKSPSTGSDCTFFAILAALICSATAVLLTVKTKRIQN